MDSKLIIIMGLLLGGFFISPFIYKGITGSYPLGFPIQDSSSDSDGFRISEKLKDLPKSNILNSEDHIEDCRDQRFPDDCSVIPVKAATKLCEVCKDVEKQILDATFPEDEVTLEYLANKPRPSFSREHVFSRNDTGNWYLESDRKAAKKLLKRNYKDPLKIIFDPGLWVIENLDHHVDALKIYGANAMGVPIDYRYNNGYSLGSDSITEEDKIKETINSIIKAKANGFAVELLLIPTDPITPVIGDPENFLEDSKEAILKWARIAEEYSVEYYNPFSEFEGHYYYLIAGPHEIVNDEVFVFLNKWENDLLPEIREIFKGKITYKSADITPEGTYFGDFDLFGLDFSPINVKSFEENLDFFDSNYEHLVYVSGRDNVDWYVGEFWVHHTCVYLNPFGTDKYCPSVEVPLDQMADYHEASFEKYLSIDDPRKKGYAFDGYSFTAQGVKDTPAEEVLNKYFNII